MNGILLDTHIIVWWLDGDSRLSLAARARVARENDVFVSAISLWEVAIKVSTGRFSVNIEQMVDSIAKAGFYALPMAFQHDGADKPSPDPPGSVRPHAGRAVAI